MIPDSIQPGQPTDLAALPSLPAALTTTTPAASAASNIVLYGLLAGSAPAPPPHELLITSAPSLTACSNASISIMLEPLPPEQSSVEYSAL